MSVSKKRQVGAHVSIAGGISKAILRGTEIGADCIQTFASSPRTIKFKPIDEAEIEKYKTAKSKSEIGVHVFHGVYLINLAHENEEYRQMCVASLVYYQKLAAAIGGLGTTFHIGSHKGSGMEKVMDRVVDGITKVLREMPDGVWLLLENAAGHKGTIGQSLNELQQIMKAVADKGVDESRLGLCLDTQHLFASGYDIRDPQASERLMEEVDKKIGMNKVKLIHVNDSATEFGSGKDKHENIDEGKIGGANIARFLNHSSLKDLPLILEVPGENKSGPRQEDVEKLRRFLEK